MVILAVLACLAGMVWIDAKTMGPTIIHCRAFINCDLVALLAGWVGVPACFRFLAMLCCIGAMVTSLLKGNLFEAALVFFRKVLFELRQCLSRFVLIFPFVDSVIHDAGLSKRLDDKFHGCAVGYGFVACSRQVLCIAHLEP